VLGKIFSRKTYRVKCPDGTIRDVYKNVDDAFPLFIQGFQADVTAELKAIDGLSAKAKAAYATKLQGLLYGLDEHNHSLMMNFRAVYVVFQSDPCGSIEFLRRSIEKLCEDQKRLSDLRTKVRALIELAKNQKAESGEVFALFRVVVDGFSGPIVGEAAALEIAESRAIAKIWIEGGEDER